MFLFSKYNTVAEAAALLHDIGRLEQYQRYRTFMDHRSENHAALGVRIIRDKLPQQSTRVDEIYAWARPISRRN